MANLTPQLSGVRIFDSDGDPLDWTSVITELSAMPKDIAGRQASNTVFGEAVMGMREDSISVQFQYNLSTRDVKTPTVTGSGLVIHSLGRAGASVGAGVGDCVIETVDSLRYRPGHEVTAQFTSVYVGMQSGVKHYHGVLDSSDGFAFGSKDGVFGIWFVSEGVETFIPQSTWLGDKLDGSGVAHVLDPTALNIYQVQYGWLGIAPAVFSVYCGYRLGWKVVHWIDLVNAQSTPHIRNPALPIRLRTVRASGTGTSSVVYSSSMRAGVTAGEVESNSSNRWFSNTQLDAAPAGVANTRYNILTINNRSTFQGRPNHVVLEISVVAFDNSTNRTLAVYGSKGSTLTGASAATEVDTANSVCTYQTGGTVTGGSQGPATVQRNGSGQRIDVRGTGILVYPGESFTLEVVGTQNYSGTFSVSARWRELF